MATKIMTCDPVLLRLQASNQMLTVSSIMTRSIKRTINDQLPLINGSERKIIEYCLIDVDLRQWQDN